MRAEVSKGLWGFRDFFRALLRHLGLRVLKLKLGETDNLRTENHALTHVECYKMGRKSKAMLTAAKLPSKAGLSKSVVKNKVLRQALHRKEKLLKLKDKRERRKRKLKERQELGDKVNQLLTVLWICLVGST